MGTVESIQPKTDLQREALPQGYVMRIDGLYAFTSAPEESQENAHRTDTDESLYLCPPFDVLGYHVLDDGSSQGIVIKFSDIAARQQRMVVHLSDLATGPQKMLRTFFDRGFMPSTDRAAAKYLRDFFLQIRPSSRCHVVRNGGWFDPETFVMHGRAIGRSSERILCDASSSAGSISQAEQRSNLEQWRQSVGALCKDNSRLLFALSLSFAAPLVPLMGVGPGIFHLRGSTSSGKTSLLHAVASVQSSPQRIYSWNVSGAGLEAAALANNHMLMLMDEFAEIPARKAQALVYQITNGHGALRARSDGSMREDTCWQTMVLSAGEIGIEQHCETLGVRLAAGQKVRMLDIEAEVKDGHGIFENLHGYSTGAEFSRKLVEAAAACYGSALPFFLEKLCDEDKQRLCQAYHDEEDEFIRANLRLNAPGSLVRVTQRFFLAGFAGELATKYGVTGWDEGEAMHAAEQMLKSWLKSSYALQEQHTQGIIEQVHTFLEQNSRRFYALDAHNERNFSDEILPSNLAGYKINTPEGRNYFVKAGLMKNEVLKGFDYRNALNALTDAAIILPNKNSAKAYVSKRLPDSTWPPQRYYCLAFRCNEADVAAHLFS